MDITLASPRINNTQELLDEFSQQVGKAIPLLQSMELRFAELSERNLRVDMPLAPNINDKQTGFGGSISALATITGWAIVTLWLKRQSHQHPVPEQYEVMVAESHIRYLAPATGDMYAMATVDNTTMNAFGSTLQSRGAAGVTLQVSIEQSGSPVALFTGTYQARPKG